MTFLTLPPQDRSPQWIAQLTAVWEASVRATHHFLDEAAIQAIAPEVPQALRPGALPHRGRDGGRGPRRLSGCGRPHPGDALPGPGALGHRAGGPALPPGGWRTATSPRSPSTSRTSGPWTSTSAGAIRSTTAPPPTSRGGPTPCCTSPCPATDPWTGGRGCPPLAENKKPVSQSRTDWETVFS